MFRDVEKEIEMQGKNLRGSATRPFALNYRPEVDVTAELNAEGRRECQVPRISVG